MINREIVKAFSTPYSDSAVNKPIPIFTGNVEIEHGGIKVPLEGTIEFVWHRQPNVEFSFVDYSKPSPPNIHAVEVNLILPNSWAKTKIRCNHASSFHRGLVSGSEFRGIALEPIFTGKKSKIAYLAFHLANFHATLGKPIHVELERASQTWTGRLTLDIGDWLIIVDKVKDSETVYAELKDAGGYGITHAVKVERIDGKKFDLNDFWSIRNDLFYFFSFVRGFWTEPFLEIGYSASEKQIWERWYPPKTDRWTSGPSWFNPMHPERLSLFWPSFQKNLNDPTWGDVLKRAIFWYISCNQFAGGIEGSIILAQTAHELLSWTRFTTEKGISESGFERLPAVDKLRLLLIDARVPLDVPSTLKALTVRARAENWVDGAETVTGIRNLLVHLSPKNLKRMKRLTEDEMIEAYKLSMWYLDLMLLNLLGYNDHYYNRCIPGKWAGQTESVPWMPIEI